MRAKKILLVCCAVMFIVTSLFSTVGHFSSGTETIEAIEGIGSTRSSLSAVDPEETYIHISGNDDFADKADEEEWPGDGTEESPYIIEGYDIDGGYEYGIYIEDTTVHFQVLDCEISDMGQTGVYLKDVTNGRITDNYLASNMMNGILLEDSFNNSIEFNFIEDQDERGSEAAISLVGSNDNDLSENTVWNNLEAAGMTLQDSSSNTIIDNNVSHNMGGGIRLASSHDNIIENNYLWDSEGGIILTHSNGNSIIDNGLEIGEGAVVLVYSDYNEISQNLLERIEDKAVILRFSENNDITENRINEPGWFGIDFMEDATDNVVQDNIIIGGVKRRGGMSVRFMESSDDNHLVDNEITGNDGWGLMINRSNGNTVDNNIIEENRGGILLLAAVDCTLTENTMDDGIIIEGNSPEYWDTHDIDESNTVNGDPVYYWANRENGTIPDAGQVILASSSGVTVGDQTISNVDTGILVGFSDQNTFSSNIISDSEHGIRILHSDANSIEDNTLSDNENAMNLTTSHDNIIKLNDIENNGNGLWLNGSYHNEIYHNNFVDNEKQAHDDEDNHWNTDYPYGGNYWSDHDGEDFRKGEDRDEWGSDGIGDTPYRNIEGLGDAEDAYPLMNPVPTPHVRLDSPEDETLINEENVTIKWTAMYRFSSILEHLVRIEDGEWIDKDEVSEHTFSGLDEGDHEVEVKVMDEAGNEAVSSVIFTVDTVPPYLEITDPTDGEMINEDEVTVYWESEPEGSDIERHEVRLDEGEWVEADGETSHTFVGISDGEYTAEVKAVDEAGNEAVSSVIFTVDTVPPYLEITDPTDGEMINEDEVTVYWESEPEGSDIERHEVRLDEGEWVEADGETSHTFADISDGEYTAEVKAVDEAGNEAVENVNFIFDTSPPELEIIAPSPDEKVEESDVTVQWEGRDDISGIARYEVRLEGEDWIELGADTTYHTFEDLQDGDHTFEIRAVDEAGNEVFESVTFVVEAETDDDIEDDRMFIADHWWIFIVIILAIILILVMFVRRQKQEEDEYTHQDRWSQGPPPSPPSSKGGTIDDEERLKENYTFSNQSKRSQHESHHTEKRRPSVEAPPPAPPMSSDGKRSQIRTALDALKKKDERIDIRGVESALNNGNLRMAEAILEQLEKKYDEYERIMEELNLLDQKRVGRTEDKKEDIEARLNYIRKQIFRDQ